MAQMPLVLLVLTGKRWRDRNTTSVDAGHKAGSLDRGQPRSLTNGIEMLLRAGKV